MPREIRPDHVAIYIRWSTEDQGDGTTLAVQTEACLHYLKSQGWTPRDDLTFIDDGYSGGSLERPALTRLRKAVQQGEVDCVVVFRLDRLSRSVIDTVTLVLQEWEELTYLKSAREPVDTTTAMGKQFFYMLVSYAEWERNVIRERMFGGKLRRAREGRNPGMPAAYGYQRGAAPGSLAVAEQEAAAVRLAFALADRGLSIRQITARLNRDGFPTRKGGPWGASMVGKLLRNPLYAGRLIWGRRRLNPRFGKAAGEPKFREAEPHAAVASSTIPPIVEPALFDRVQARLQERQGLAPGAAGSSHLLSGLLRCGACGSPMQYNGYRRWAYYRCAARAEGGRCDAPSLPAALTEEQVVALLAERVGPQVVQSLQEQQADHLRRHQAELETARAALAAALGRLNAQRRRINQDYRLGQITAADRRHLLGETEQEECALHQRAGELAQQAEALAGRPVPVPPDPWAALAPPEQKQVLRFFLNEIRALRTAPDKVTIEMVWASP